MRIIVIGAGPAGIMASIQASKNKSNQVIIIEKNSSAGKKLNITGKGRCNITYEGDNEYFLSNVVTNSKFLMSSINAFNNSDLIKFVNNLGVKTKQERGNRIFLYSDDAKELTYKLEIELKKNNIEVIRNTVVKSINVEEGKILGVTLEDGKILDSDRVIIATGGKSYPLTGSTGDGYSLAKKVGHSVIEPKAALVPFKLYEKDICKRLEGLTLKNVSLRVESTYEGKNRVLDERFRRTSFYK